MHFDVRRGQLDLRLAHAAQRQLLRFGLGRLIDRQQAAQHRVVRWRVSLGCLFTQRRQVIGQRLGDEAQVQVQRRLRVITHVLGHLAQKLGLFKRDELFAQLPILMQHVVRAAHLLRVQRDANERVEELDAQPQRRAIVGFQRRFAQITSIDGDQVTDVR